MKICAGNKCTFMTSSCTLLLVVSLRADPASVYAPGCPARGREEGGEGAGRQRCVCQWGRGGHLPYLAANVS